MGGHHYLLMLKEPKSKKVPYPIFANMMGIRSVVKPLPVALTEIVRTRLRRFAKVHWDSPAKDSERITLSSDFLRPDLGRVQETWNDDEHTKTPQKDKEER